MTAATLNGYSDPGKIASAMLAVLVHLALFALLFFGVQWHSAEVPAVEVELWTSPPQAAAPQPAPLPPVEPVIEPPLEPQIEPRIEPQVPAPPPPVIEPKPIPKPQPVAKPEPKPVVKPDIALEQKKEKERKLREEQAKAQAQEQARVDKLKQQQVAERAKALKDRNEQLRKEQMLAQAQRLAGEEQNQRNAQRAAAKSRANDEYVGKIRSKIRSNIVMAGDIAGNPEAVFEVVQLPSGDIISATLRKSSGNPAYDAAVNRAILKSSPLPKPNEPGLFNRDLQLKFRPQDSN